MSKDFVKNDDIVGVSFSTPMGSIIKYACQDPDAKPRDLGLNTLMDPQNLLKTRRLRNHVFGTVASVTAPVLQFQFEGHGDATTQPTRLLGYVTISLSDQESEQALGRVYLILVLVGCVVLLLTFPAVYLIVYRIFSPIRQLVVATESIAQGNWDTAVAVDRPDLIGTLSRSFNQMVRQVKHQREALADANRDLEKKVTQRTAQLETANNRLSSEIAEKEDFLRAVSHDLNAPLRNISGMATMLLMKSREKFDDEIIHRLERIQKNVEAETDLISELLELSRIKTRRQKMEPVNVTELVTDIGAVLENDLRQLRNQVNRGRRTSDGGLRESKITAGVPEPDRQCNQVHGRRRGAGNSRGLPRRRDGSRVLRQRHRHRNRPGGHREGLFRVPPREEHRVAQCSRQRRGPGEREEHRRDL